jgi:hypothetical protein
MGSSTGANFRVAELISTGGSGGKAEDQAENRSRLHGIERQRMAFDNRRKVVVERPVFPGSLFVCFAPEQRQLVLPAQEPCA